MTDNAYGQSDTKMLQKRLIDTTITGRLRTVSWANNSHQIGVINFRFKGPTLSLPATVVQSMGQPFKI